MSQNQGIVSYDPTELVITARAGTRLREIKDTLAGHGQMLAFEPPGFGESATLGGTIACGFSGPRRPYAGAARDFVLGLKCINGCGEILKFGGQVMKNVAGFDVSRLMTGTMGTLGVLLEISLKVLPIPEYEQSFRKRVNNVSLALKIMNEWAGKPVPLSAASYYGEYLLVRLSGKHNTVEHYANELKLETVLQGNDYWRDLCEHDHSFFDNERTLWRLSLPSHTSIYNYNEPCLIDWGGAQHWLLSDRLAEKIRDEIKALNGHATLFRGSKGTDEVFHPLSAQLEQLHKKIKRAFDPAGILNPGKMYEDI